MLFTHADPRARWREFLERPGDPARLEALPAGAREAPLGWVCEVAVESRGHFDKDAQGEVFHDFRTVTGWRDAPDPRVQLAGELSFHSIDVVQTDVWFDFPGERLGTGLSALTLQGHHLHPRALEFIGRSRPWADLCIQGARWSRESRAAGVRELAAAFPRLRGLELHTASLDASDLAALAAAAFVPQLEDLTLTNGPLDPPGARGLIDRLGALIHLDLHEARLGSEVIKALASKLRRARRIKLSDNPLGDEGVRALLEAGALGQVEDLSLSGCALTDGSLFALAQAELPRLQGLWLDSNQFTDEGVEALVRAPFFRRLEGLSLFQRQGLTARAEQALAGQALAGALTSSVRLPGQYAMWFMGR